MLSACGKAKESAYSGLDTQVTGPDSQVGDATPVGTLEALAQAGSIRFSLHDFQTSIAELRVLNYWRSGAPPDLAALANPLVRRRLLRQALDTAIIRQEIERRRLEIDPLAIERGLLNAAAGRNFDLKNPPLLDPDALAVALAQRYGASLTQVRRVVLDLLGSSLLANSLLDEVSDAELEKIWRAETSKIIADVIRIPRVPRSSEIDAFVREKKTEIDTYYQSNRARYQTPERVVVHRIFIKSATGRPTIEALRSRVSAGEDFADIARAHSAGSAAKRGGRIGPVSQTRLPVAFTTKLGALTPIIKEPGGWSFYRVGNRQPAVHRQLSDPRVRREIAATLLRKSDTLPTARRIADRARALLQQAPEGEALKTLVKTERLRRHTSPSFSPASSRVIPGLGLAVSVNKELAEPTTQLTRVHTIRQEYVVVRVVSRQTPALDAWAVAREKFVAQWRTRQFPHAVEQFIGRYLKGKPLWIDSKRLVAIDNAELIAPLGPN